MLDWGTILYGAVLSAVIAAFALVALGERRRLILGAGTLSALIAPIAWNAILRATHARQFFTDAPIALLPASWQDTGSTWSRRHSRTRRSARGGRDPA